MKEKNCASYLDPTSSLFQALPLPTANMIGSGTTNLTQISGHCGGSNLTSQCATASLPSLPSPTVASLRKDTYVLLAAG